MSTELKLYFLDGRSAEHQRERESALHTLFDNNAYWSATEWRTKRPDLPHHYVTLETNVDPSVQQDLNPALGYIANKLTLESGLARTISELIHQMRTLMEDKTILDVTITLPDGALIRLSGDPPEYPPTLMVNNESQIQLDATSEEIAVFDELQNLENSAELRIKFASMDSRGRYVGDCSKEYEGFFDDIQPGWTCDAREPISIETLSERQRGAYPLRFNGTTVAAVEHETGLEILIAIGVSVTASAIFELSKWGLKKWIHRRETLAAKGESKVLVVLEIKRRRSGRTKILRLKTPLDDKNLFEVIKKFTDD